MGSGAVTNAEGAQSQPVASKGVVLFGPPGAGKGTQAAFMVQHLGFEHISTGVLFREHIREGTALGKQAQSYIDTGSLVPDDVTTAMLGEALSKMSAEDFVLDGYPRNVDQADALEGLLTAKGLRLQKVLCLQVPYEELEARLSGRRVCESCERVFHIKTHPPITAGLCDTCKGRLRGRPDDQPSAIRTRVKVYEERTLVLKEYYERKGLLAVVEASGDVLSVWRQVKRLLEAA